MCFHCVEISNIVLVDSKFENIVASEDEVIWTQRITNFEWWLLLNEIVVALADEVILSQRNKNFEWWVRLNIVLITRRQGGNNRGKWGDIDAWMAFKCSCKN